MFKWIIRALHKRKNVCDIRIDADIDKGIENNLKWQAPCVARSQAEVLERIKKIKKHI